MHAGLTIAIALIVGAPGQTPPQARRLPLDHGVRLFEQSLQTAVTSALQDVVVRLEQTRPGATFGHDPVEADGFTLPPADTSVIFVVQVPEIRAYPPAGWRPSPAELPPAFNPAEMLAARVRERVIDAMLTASRPLALAPDAWFTVVAIEGGAGRTATRRNKLYMNLRAADLELFRAGKLTRSEIVARVVIVQGT